jgi:hypothetical protein
MKSQELSYQKQLNRMELNLEKGRTDIEVGSFLYRITILYSETCLIRISLGPDCMFRIDRCSVYTGHSYFQKIRGNNSIKIEHYLEH